MGRPSFFELTALPGCTRKDRTEREVVGRFSKSQLEKLAGEKRMYDQTNPDF